MYSYSPSFSTSVLGGVLMSLVATVLVIDVARHKPSLRVINYAKQSVTDDKSRRVVEQITVGQAGRGPSLFYICFLCPIW